MPQTIRRKIRISNHSQKEISVIIEPIGNEENLPSGKTIYIDLTFRDEIDYKDHLSIDYHEDYIALYEEGDIDMRFSDRSLDK